MERQLVESFRSLRRENFSGGIDWQAFGNAYNTYHPAYPGLPPGPIGNPGKESLQSVLEAEKTNIKYMAARSEWKGAHCFSMTYKGHLRCIRGERDPETDDQ